MKHTIVVNGYYIDVFKSDDGYIGKVRNLENCFTEGKDLRDLKLNSQNRINDYLKRMMDKGLNPPQRDIKKLIVPYLPNILPSTNTDLNRNIYLGVGFLLSKINAKILEKTYNNELRENLDVVDVYNNKIFVGKVIKRLDHELSYISFQDISMLFNDFVKVQQDILVTLECLGYEDAFGVKDRIFVFLLPRIF